MSFDNITRIILPPNAGETVTITSRFGNRNIKHGSKNHKGIDLSYSGKQGGVISTSPPFYSPVSGTVTRVGGPSSTYNEVTIKDATRTIGGKPVFHRFIHNQEVLVKEGQSVSVGQKLGRVGKRGGIHYHVHYEVRIGGGYPDGKATDPIAFWDGEKQIYIPDVPKEIQEPDIIDTHEENPQHYKTEAGKPPVPYTPPKATEIDPPAQPSGHIDDYKPRQAGRAYYSEAQFALWTNRVPQHEPWPRVMMGDTLHINAPSEECDRNTRHNPQYDENHKDVGRVEGEDEIKRGPFWRR
jgi:Membrane proteins related to metalloendopeptidases